MMNPLIRDAMRRAGEEVPPVEPIACSTNPQEDALDFAKELQQTRAFGWVSRYSMDFMDEKKRAACKKALAGLKAAISALEQFPK